MVVVLTFPSSLPWRARSGAIYYVADTFMRSVDRSTRVCRSTALHSPVTVNMREPYS